jgi:hypothetical protein
MAILDKKAEINGITLLSAGGPEISNAVVMFAASEPRVCEHLRHF